jgi:hypothetical protein
MPANVNDTNAKLRRVQYSPQVYSAAIASAPFDDGISHAGIAVALSGGNGSGGGVRFDDDIWSAGQSLSNLNQPIVPDKITSTSSVVKSEIRQRNQYDDDKYQIVKNSLKESSSSSSSSSCSFTPLVDAFLAEYCSASASASASPPAPTSTPTFVSSSPVEMAKPFGDFQKSLNNSILQQQSSKTPASSSVASVTGAASKFVPNDEKEWDILLQQQQLHLKQQQLLLQQQLLQVQVQQEHLLRRYLQKQSSVTPSSGPTAITGAGSSGQLFQPEHLVDGSDSRHTTAPFGITSSTTNMDMAVNFKFGSDVRQHVFALKLHQQQQHQISGVGLGIGQSNLPEDCHSF